MPLLIEISNLSYVDRPKRFGGSSLRFTWAFHADTSDGNIAELAMDGCLAYYRGDNEELVWTAPISRWTPVATKQLHWINPYLYNLTKEALLNNPKVLAPVKKVYREMQELKTKDRLGIWGSQVDPNLPKLIKVRPTPPLSAEKQERMYDLPTEFPVYTDGPHKPPTAFRGDNYGHYVKKVVAKPKRKPRRSGG